MLQSLITSKTRIKLLVRFFVNAQNTGYLRGLEAEFGEATNAIRMELNRFEEAGLLLTHTEQNRKVFRANTKHPFFNDINKLLLKYVGIEQIVENVVQRVGNLLRAYVTGDFARGLPGKQFELLLVGNNFDLEYINQLVSKAEQLVSFKVSLTMIAPDEEESKLKDHEVFIPVWGK
jgi:hypothetical protein